MFERKEVSWKVGCDQIRGRSVCGNLAFSFKQCRRYLRSFSPCQGRARKKASLRVETAGRPRVPEAARRSRRLQQRLSLSQPRLPSRKPPLNNCTPNTRFPKEASCVNATVLNSFSSQLIITLFLHIFLFFS